MIDKKTYDIKQSRKIADDKDDMDGFEYGIEFHEAKVGIIRNKKSDEDLPLRFS